MKCFYHNDLDGRCAAAIVRMAVGNQEDDGTGFSYIELDYKDDVPIDKIGNGEQVIIVDFSFKPEVMAEVLKKTSSITWIDHHKTAFEYDYGIELMGLRNKEFSGCELAWQYFFRNDKIPRWVVLIGDRDKWAWKYGAETAEFNLGMQVRAHQPADGVWQWLSEYPTTAMTSIQKDGRVALCFRDQFCKDYAESYGFPTTFEGHKCFALGIYMFGSEAFGERMKQYDICLSFVFDGKKHVVGLYSQKIDVSEIAKSRGGGGHTGAAGFTCDKLPFAKS